MRSTEEISQNLIDIYNGDAWHGPNIMSVVSKIDVSKKDARIGNGHSVIELVMHMVAWRKFVTERLNGNNDFDISDENNFPLESNWQKAISELERSQNVLLEAISQFDPSRLDQTVPTRKDSFRKVLQGIIHHDLYHLGQITMIIKQF
ncbi:MAG: DinB family protein [Cyclobacteriaceae bacterium]